MIPLWPSIKFAQKGYFLIELLISLSTLFIVVTLVLLFHYPVYIKRAKVAEGLVLAHDLVKTRLVEHYSIYGQLPVVTSDLSGSFKSTGQYTQSIRVDKGAVTANLNLSDHQSALLTLRPAFLEDSDYQIIIPLCGYATPPTQRVVVYGENKTNISKRYLTHICR